MPKTTTKKANNKVKFAPVENTDLLPAGEYVFVFGEKGSSVPHSVAAVTAHKTHHVSLAARQAEALLTEKGLNPNTTWCRVTGKENPFGNQVSVPWQGVTPAELKEFAVESQTFWQRQLAAPY